MNQSDTSTLRRIKERAQDLQGARTARQRYEISREINNLSKHAQADKVAIPPKLSMNKTRWCLENTRTEYDRKADTFYVYALPKEPASHVYYINGKDALALVARDTQEIVGYQIDNFGSEWIKKYPMLEQKADKAKTLIAHPLLRRFNGAWADFTGAVVNVLALTPKDVHPGARLIL